MIVPAELTRTTPVSSTQYAAVPVEAETGVALIEKPTSPDGAASRRNACRQRYGAVGVNVKV